MAQRLFDVALTVKKVTIVFKPRVNTFLKLTVTYFRFNDFW